MTDVQPATPQRKRDGGESPVAADPRKQLRPAIVSSSSPPPQPQPTNQDILSAILSLQAMVNQRFARDPRGEGEPPQGEVRVHREAHLGHDSQRGAGAPRCSDEVGGSLERRQAEPRADGGSGHRGQMPSTRTASGTSSRNFLDPPMGHRSGRCVSSRVSVGTKSVWRSIRIFPSAPFLLGSVGVAPLHQPRLRDAWLLASVSGACSKARKSQSGRACNAPRMSA